MRREGKYVYEANYTQEIRQVQGDTYGGYKLIGRDMDVRGGVFHTKNSSAEAVVVNPDAHPDIYWEYFNEVCERTRGAHPPGEFSQQGLVGAIYETVEAKMRSSPAGVAHVRRRRGPAAGQTIELGVFMKAGVGECRHQALACAVLMEDFKETGLLHGDISVDRSRRWNPDNAEDRSGHAWARYTDSDGTVYILDPAQKFFGTLTQSTKSAKWNYFRREDEYERYVMLQRKLGQAGIRGFLNRMRWLATGG